MSPNKESWSAPEDQDYKTCHLNCNLKHGKIRYEEDATEENRQDRPDKHSGQQETEDDLRRDGDQRV